MSLLYWLPFTDGTVKEQGLSNDTPTIGGTSVVNNTNGKLGKCLSFGTNDGYIQMPLNAINGITGSCSVAFWLNLKSYNANYSTIFSVTKRSYSWGGELLTFQRAASGHGFTFHISNGTNHTTMECTSSNLELDTWYHIVCVYDATDGEIRIFLNGDLDSSYKTAVVPAYSSATDFRIGKSYIGYQGDFLMNDFRLYDESLSLMQIKELAKGLVLHYPMNRGGFGGDNYALASDTEKSNKNSNNIWTLQTGSPTELSGNTVTVSADIKCTVDDVSCDTYFRSSSGMVGSSTRISGITTEYKRYSATFKATTSTNYISISFRNNGKVSGANTSATYYYKNVKVELGDHATPRIPNSADALYSAMGLDDGIEYDVSGYGNNGIATGNLTYSSDTPRYNVSTTFNGTDYIVAPSINGEIKTMSAWFKTTKSKSTSQFICAEYNSKLCISLYSGTIISYFGIGPGTGSKCTLGDSYIENGWNHVVVIATGDNTRDVYCNGVKLTPANNDYWSPAAGFLIGSRNSSGTLPFYGSISDVRAYTTQLTEDDILELYHTPISIASNGTLLTQGEISEV